MKTIVLLAALAGAAMTAGCASMVHGRTQRIPVTSSPAGAAITVKCAGEEEYHAGYTPATIELRRDADGCRLMLTKRGYAEETIRFRRVHSPVTALNAVPSLLLGGASALLAYIPASLVAPEPVADAAGAAAFDAGADAPYAIDERSGAAYEQQPRSVSVELEPRPR